MMDNDACQAILLGCFEHLCNLELERLDNSSTPLPDGEDPWLICDMEEIRRSMLGFFSKRTIVDGIRRLADCGLIESERRGLGKPNRYRFNSKVVQGAINSRLVFECKIALEETDPECSSECKIASSASLGASLGASLHTLLNCICIGTCHCGNGEKGVTLSEEPSAKDSISVDNNAEWVHTLWKEVFGQDLMLSTKDRRWIEEILIPRFPVPLDKLVEYSTAETGKPTFKKFRDFLPGNKPAMFRRRPEFGPVASQDRSTGASGSRRYQTERQAPPSSFIAPVEASDWNEQISGRQWEVWDSKLNDAWMALPKSPFPWPKLLAKCVLLAPHKPDLTIGFALKHWASIINGNMDWLIPHEKPSHLQTKQDRIRALVQAHEARKKEKNDGIERAKP